MEIPKEKERDENLGDKILAGAKFVVDNSEQVKINENMIFAAAKRLGYHFKRQILKHWLDDVPLEFSTLDDKEKLNFLFLLNSLSFSYWGGPKWSVEYKGQKYDGVRGMIAALGKAKDAGIINLDSADYSSIGEDELKEIFAGNVEIPMFQERLKILRENSNILKEKFGGRVENVIEKANGDALKLLEIITDNFPSFRDTSKYKGREILFYKRAQLLVHDIYQVFGGKSFGKLENIGKLTACADYKVPQILRKVGVLFFGKDLQKKIDDGIEISHDSAEEVEIRASTIWAVELIKKEINKDSKQPATSMQINDMLWLSTQEKFSFDRPYHLTRTTDY